MGSDNPLFLDSEYAANTRWGGIIAPPAMVGQAIIAPGLRGIQWIYAGIAWEFFQVMRPAMLSPSAAGWLARWRSGDGPCPG